MMATLPQIKTGNGCGCSGGGASGTGGGASGTSGATCSCGRATCESCQTVSFVRPRFFAGQLLTEEDLELLGEYTVAKNRLHNRHFWGDGVVCGLEVSCHPCGGGTVVVEPGHALDCCGNDIVLTCATELDVNAMVRELRISSQGGFDCGDPCRDPKKPPAPPAPGVTSGLAGWTATPPADHPHPDVREYCLYVRFCEQPADAVTPYDTGDACGVQACKPTRVREGVRFELRCREDKGCCAGTLGGKICDCLKDEVVITRVKADSGFLVRYNRHLGAVTRAQRSGTPIVTAARVSESTDTLTKLVEPSVPTWTEEQFLEGVDAAHTVLVFAAEQMTTRTRPGVERAVAAPSNEGSRAVEAVRKFHAEAAKRFPGPARETLSRIDRAYATAVMEQVGAFDATAGPGPQVELMASGVLPSAAFHAELNASVRALRGDLIERARKKPRKTDCTVERTLNALYVPATFQPSVGAGPEARQYLGRIYESSSVLVHHSKDLLLECFCDHVNPPCPPCDDLGVLIACLEVKDCEVVRICNLERKFVLTPVALRYWFPALCQIGEAVEELCCPGVECPPDDAAREPDDQSLVLSRVRGSAQTPMVRTLLALFATQIAACCETSLDRAATKDQTIAQGLFDRREAGLEALGRAMIARERAPEPEEGPRENRRLRRRVADLERRLSKLERTEP